MHWNVQKRRGNGEAIEVIINYIFFLVFNVDEEGFYTQISLF